MLWTRAFERGGAGIPATARRAARLVDQPGAAADERRHRRVEGGKPGDPARQPVGIPEVVLVGEGVVVGPDARIAGKAEEVGREAPARSRADLDPLRPDLGAERREERRGGVGRPVVARDQPPVAMPLPRDRRKLLAEEGRPVAGAHQDGDLREAAGGGWGSVGLRAQDLGLMGSLDEDRQRLDQEPTRPVGGGPAPQRVRPRQVGAPGGRRRDQARDVPQGVSLVVSNAVGMLCRTARDSSAFGESSRPKVEISGLERAEQRIPVARVYQSAGPRLLKPLSRERGPPRVSGRRSRAASPCRARCGLRAA